MSRPLVGVLSSGIPWEIVERAFYREGLAQLGYRDGQSIRIERRFATGTAELPGFAAQLLALEPDVILACGLPALRALRDAGSLFQTVGVLPDADFETIIDEGFVSSIAQPGFNVTAIVGGTLDLWGKRLELLVSAVPAARRVAVLWDLGAHGPWMEYPRRVDIERFSTRLNLELLPAELSDGAELESAFALVAEQGAQGIIIPPSDIASVNGPSIQSLLQAFQLPSVSATPNLTEIALLSYLPNLAAMNRRAAQLVSTVLNAGRPAQIPLGLAPDFQVTVNLAAARALGLTLPRTLTSQGAQTVR